MLDWYSFLCCKVRNFISYPYHAGRQNAPSASPSRFVWLRAEILNLIVPFDGFQHCFLISDKWTKNLTNEQIPNGKKWIVKMQMQQSFLPADEIFVFLVSNKDFDFFSFHIPKVPWFNNEKKSVWRIHFRVHLPHRPSHYQANHLPR
jgi:hypothetical protein